MSQRRDPEIKRDKEIKTKPFEKFAPRASSSHEVKTMFFFFLLGTIIGMFNLNLIPKTDF